MRNFAVNKFKKAMKRLYKYTSMLLLLAAGIFASCDSDTHRAVILSGEWRGNFGMYYDYNYRGTVVTFDSYDTYIVFYPDYNYASHGWGKQVDYYDYGPYEYQYHRFLWTVEGGVVYLRYPHEPELDTSIADYRLSSNTFTGYFTNASSRFVLYKLSSFYDWDEYSGDYYYYDRPNWDRVYYAKSRAAADSVPDAATPVQGSIVRHGNRFTDGADK